jgi:hypothetical protein
MECKPSFNNNIYENIDSTLISNNTKTALNGLIKDDTISFSNILLNYRTSSAVTNLYLQKRELLVGNAKGKYKNILEGVDERSQFLSTLRHHFLGDNDIINLLTTELSSILKDSDPQLTLKLVNANQLSISKSINSVALRKTSKSDLLFGVD